LPLSPPTPHSYQICPVCNGSHKCRTRLVYGTIIENIVCGSDNVLVITRILQSLEDGTKTAHLKNIVFSSNKSCQPESNVKLLTIRVLIQTNKSQKIFPQQTSSIYELTPEVTSFLPNYITPSCVILGTLKISTKNLRNYFGGYTTESDLKYAKMIECDPFIGELE